MAEQITTFSEEAVANRTLHWYDYLFINSNWFALTLRSQMLAGLAVPLLVEQFVGEAHKGAYFGSIRLWGLMAALLFQAFFGVLSDHSRSRWGRRRPFIFVGAILEVFIIMSIAWIAGLEGMTGYTLLFGAYLLSMLSSNMSQAATQGLIPDLVPQEKRGIASGIKVLLEIPLPLILFGLILAPMVKRGSLGIALAVTCAFLLLCMGLTMFTHERRLQEAPSLDWKPFTSLALMAAVFTLIILGLGQIVKWATPMLKTALQGASIPIALGILGVAIMLIAVVAGVVASLRVHLRGQAKEQSSFTWWVITRLAALVAINNIGTFLLYFVQEKFNLPGNEAAGLAGTLPMILGVCVILFGLVAGWLSDRYDRKLLTFVSGIIGAFGVAMTVITTSVTWLYIAAIFIGLAYALFNVSSWALGTDIIPKQRAGEYMGLQNLAGAGAGAIGAYIGGPIADASGYVLLMSIFGVMFLASSAAVLFIRLPKQIGAQKA
jgi:MFS family permease